MKQIDYLELDPGVRDLVRELREVHGLEATDSGDGSKFAAGMQGTRRERHVCGVVPAEVCDLRAFGDKLRSLYPNAVVDVSYQPPGPAVWDLMPDGWSDETLAEMGVSRGDP